MQVIATIKTCYPSLTRSERKAADFVLADPGAVGRISLLEMARKLAIGEATIVRFCQKIGLAGFQELRFHLSAEADGDETCEEGDSESIKNNLVKNLEMTDSMVNTEVTGQVIDWIASADEVLFYGIGTSGLSASMGEMRLTRFGKKHVRAVRDPHVQNTLSSLCDEKTLVIAVSVSGETKDLIESVGLAKEAGAHIVAITNYVNSTLAGLADATLLSYGKTNLINAGTFSSVVSQMFLLDIITSGYAVRYSDEVAQSQAKVGWSLLSKTTS